MNCGKPPAVATQRPATTCAGTISCRRRCRWCNADAAAGGWICGRKMATPRRSAGCVATALRSSSSRSRARSALRQRRSPVGTARGRSERRAATRSIAVDAAGPRHSENGGARRRSSFNASRCCRRWREDEQPSLEGPQDGGRVAAALRRRRHVVAGAA